MVRAKQVALNLCRYPDRAPVLLRNVVFLFLNKKKKNPNQEHYSAR